VTKLLNLRLLHVRGFIVFLFAALLTGSILPASSTAAQTPESEKPKIIARPVHLQLTTQQLAQLPKTAGVRTPTELQGWAEILREDFEDPFPGPGWAVLDGDNTACRRVIRRHPG
jgi:hypothetical protein